MVTYSVATQAKLPEIMQLYRANGYGADVSPDDRVLIAEAEDKIVGVVRICEEGGRVILRGMHVKPGFRGRGIGTVLLSQAAEAIGARSCYCVPYTHLQSFYSQVGFQMAGPERTPAFLRRRREEYRARGLDVVVMFRPGIGEVAAG